MRPHSPPCGGRQKGISIHAPLAGCDCVGRQGPAEGHHFNPRTPCGVRLCHSLLLPSCGDFNPRTPCGVRPGKVDQSAADGSISIHAPLAGCDSGRNLSSGKKGNFNPRTPCGVRRQTRDAHLTGERFQSTHPLRGATLVADHGHIDVVISIHAPLAGCDCPSRPRACWPARYFNPRTPCGVRHLIALTTAL